MSRLAASFTLAALACATTSVSAHGFIKQWGLKGSSLETAQKTDVGSSSFRAAPDNTGWIGANFIGSTDAIACASSETPFGKVAAPGGTFFSTQGAGKSLAVDAGDTVQLVTSGNPGEGWPHHTGHLQTYMADCGGDCKSFDATKGEFFKIQSELNGVVNTLIPAYDSSVDGNRYDVQIPASVPAGDYLFRFEIIAFGQSSSAEGNQDQYYPFCGQMTVGGGNGKRDGDLAKRAAFARAVQGQTVTFPGAYKSGNIDQGTAPGPSVIKDASSVSSSSGSGSSSGTSSSSGSATGSTTGSSSALALPSTAPACASMCLGVKVSEKDTLGASSCSSTDGACLCGVDTFQAAFAQCARDNCGGDADAAITAFSSACTAGGQSALETGGSGTSDCKSKSKRRRSADGHLASGRSARLHRVRKDGVRAETMALRATVRS